jgi:methionyl-tRNA formyltransferase
VLRAIAVASESPNAEPGRILAIGREGVLVACAPGSALRLLEVQPESRKAMDALAFASGTRIAPGERFET